jgi:hypothetical protein
MKFTAQGAANNCDRMSWPEKAGDEDLKFEQLFNSP